MAVDRLIVTTSRWRLAANRLRYAWRDLRAAARALRRLARHLVGAAGAALGPAPPARVFLLDTEEDLPRHPSLLCRCPGWQDDDVVEHHPACAWLAAMCRSCEGNGWCPTCHGDGTRPDA